MIEVPEKFELEGVEYNSDQLSEYGKSQLHMLQFVYNEVGERRSQLALLDRAKMSYLGNLKREILASKAGLLFEDN